MMVFSLRRMGHIKSPLHRHGISIVFWCIDRDKQSAASALLKHESWNKNETSFVFVFLWIPQDALFSLRHKINTVRDVMLMEAVRTDYCY